MKDRINQWKETLISVGANVQSQFGSLKPEELNWKPTPDSWSIAQCLDHLIVINSTYFPIIEQLKSGSYKVPFLGKFGFYTNMMGNFIYKGSEPTNKKKIKTFPIWEPSQSEIGGDIVKRFLKHQDELIAQIESCEGLMTQGAVISSPANKNIVYKLEKAFDIIVVHEQRHYQQALAVKEMMENQ